MIQGGLGVAAGGNINPDGHQACSSDGWQRGAKYTGKKRHQSHRAISAGA